MKQGLNWLFNFFIQRSCVVIIIIFSLRPCFRFIFDAFRIFLLFKLHNMKRGDRKMSQWPSQGCKFNSNTLRLCSFSILYLNSQTCLQNSILSQVAINMTHHSTLLIQAARGHVSHIILVIALPTKGLSQHNGRKPQFGGSIPHGQTDYLLCPLLATRHTKTFFFVFLEYVHLHALDNCMWGISSNGRAPASHAGGTGIDTRILQHVLLD